MLNKLLFAILNYCANNDYPICLMTKYPTCPMTKYPIYPVTKYPTVPPHLVYLCVLQII